MVRVDPANMTWQLQLIYRVLDCSCVVLDSRWVFNLPA